MNSIALDVVIGLVFVFLLYSLLATILLEVLAQFFDLRSRMLVKTVRILLDDRKHTSNNFFVRLGHHIGDNFYHFFCPLQKNKFSKVFYSHPSIKYLSRSSWASKPSYIGSNIFANTIIALLRGNNYQDSTPQMDAIYRTLYEQKEVSLGDGKTAKIGVETLTHLQLIYVNSQKDIDKFRILLEKWFDETMERSGGWYKQQTQVILLILGFFIACAFNIDSIAITKILAKDKTARENMVQLATSSAPKYKEVIQKIESNSKPNVKTLSTKDSSGKINTVTTITDTVYVAFSEKEIKDAQKLLNDDIEKASSILGLGRPHIDSCKIRAALEEQLDCEKEKAKKNKKIDNSIEIDRLTKILAPYDNLSCDITSFTGKMLLGWLLTALAISLGAPFWFDLLNKVVQLRSSIAKPKNADTGGGSSKLNNESASTIPNPVG